MQTIEMANGNGYKKPESMLKNIEPGMANVCKLEKNNIMINQHAIN